MKINRIQNHLLNTNLYKNKDKSNSKDKEIGSKDSVNIEISDSAKVLADKINQSGDTMYSEKVEQIRKAVLEGTYKVSAEDIADKIIQALEEQKDSDI
jgi:negative regulator of flagellin synthesis FlgM